MKSKKAVIFQCGGYKELIEPRKRAHLVQIPPGTKKFDNLNSSAKLLSFDKSNNLLENLESNNFLFSTQAMEILMEIGLSKPHKTPSTIK